METLRIGAKERRRLEVLSRVKSRDFSLLKAAEVLAISYRQAKRLGARFLDQGNAGLLHRLPDRAPVEVISAVRLAESIDACICGSRLQFLEAISTALNHGGKRRSLCSTRLIRLTVIS